MSTNQVEKKTEKGLGTSDTKTLSEMFSAGLSVVYDAASAMKDLLKGIKSYNPLLGSFDMDYGKSPKVTNFYPNISSPGPGNTSPNNQPPPPSKPATAGGWASLESPDEGAAKTSKQEFDKLTPGSSS